MFYFFFQLLNVSFCCFLASNVYERWQFSLFYYFLVCKAFLFLFLISNILFYLWFSVSWQWLASLQNFRARLLKCLILYVDFFLYVFFSAFGWFPIIFSNIFLPHFLFCFSLLEPQLYIFQTTRYAILIHWGFVYFLSKFFMFFRLVTFYWAPSKFIAISNLLKSKLTKSKFAFKIAFSNFAKSKIEHSIFNFKFV